MKKLAASAGLAVALGGIVGGVAVAQMQPAAAAATTPLVHVVHPGSVILMSRPNGPIVGGVDPDRLAYICATDGHALVIQDDGTTGWVKIPVTAAGLHMTITAKEIGDC